MSLRLVVLCFLLSLSLSVRAGDNDWLSLIWHNDLLVGKDGGGYTNGLFLSWYTFADEVREDFAPPWLTRPLARWLINSEDTTKLELGVHTLGQMMVTPEDVSKLEREPGDAPYAGLLYWRSGYFSYTDERVDSVAVTVGVVGPLAGAERAQKWVHEITGSTEPRGWDNQISNEPIGQIERARMWRFASGSGVRQADLLTQISGSLGNVESAARLTMVVRYGTDLRRSVIAASQLSGRVSNPMAIDRGWNVYLGVGADYVHNQIFISGSRLRSGPRTELKHEQYWLFAGGAYAWENFSATVGFSASSSLDKYSSARQGFGSVILAWRL